MNNQLYDSARVMTLEEVHKIQSVRDGAVWLEIGTGLMPALMELSTNGYTFFVAIPFTGYRQCFDNERYNITWRTWTSRPTKKDMDDNQWQRACDVCQTRISE